MVFAHSTGVHYVTLTEFVTLMSDIYFFTYLILFNTFFFALTSSNLF